MRKPIPWIEPPRLTVDVPKTGKQKQMNLKDAGNGIGAKSSRSKPCRSTTFGDSQPDADGPPEEGHGLAPASGLTRTPRILR